MHFFTGATKWPTLHGMLRKPLGNLPDLAKKFGAFAMDIGPVITTKHVLAKDANLSLLFSSHASVKQNVDEIHEMTDHIFRASTYAEPLVHNLPKGTSNIFVYAIGVSGDTLRHELVAHYGIGTIIDPSEAGELL